MAKTDSVPTIKKSVKVSIMQREFTVACQDDEAKGLIEAAAYLDKQMRAVTEGSQILGTDRCAIIAGLNISYEFLQLQKNAGLQKAVNSRLKSLHDQVDKVVSNIQQG